MNTETKGTSSPRKLVAKVIGVGCAGASVIEALEQSGAGELQSWVLHTNERALSGCAARNQILVGKSLVRGLGTGGDPDLGAAAVEGDLDLIQPAFAGADLVFIVSGLGGGTGTGGSPVLARAARETGALVVALVTLPFGFEGQRRQAQAQSGLQQLKNAADGVLCLHNQQVAKLFSEQTNLVQTFKAANAFLGQGVLGIWQMLATRGIIQVDFADFSTAVRGRHNESLFATLCATGPDRAAELGSKVLTSPLFEEGRAIDQSDTLLVSIVGGPDLTVAHINQFMEQINGRAEKARLIVGAAAVEGYEDKLQVTLIASRKPAYDVSPEAIVSRSQGYLDQAGQVDEARVSRTFLGETEDAARPSRFVAPPPELTAETREKLLTQQPSARGRKGGSRWRQGQLPLEVISKGRFEKSQPTVHNGQDLDVPTYIRRGIALN